MQMLSDEMKACVEACLKCHATCLSMAMQHCLEAGGKHLEPKHFRLMMACATMCQTSADFMLLGTPHHKQTCRVCAEICLECAQSCEIVGDMQACVDACRSCGEECRAMGI